MHERDWQLFLENGSGVEIAVAQLSAAHTTFLGAASDKLYVHHDYAKKAYVKHGFSFSDFPIIFEAVDYGLAVADRPGHLTFFHNYEGKWYQVSVKCSGDTNRLYLATMHRAKKQKVNNRLRKYPQIPK
jgi:hypothetical protein